MKYKLNTDTFQYEKSEDGMEDVCFAVLHDKERDSYTYIKHGRKGWIEEYFSKKNSHVETITVADSYRMIGEEPMVVSMKEMNWSLNDVNKIISICDYINTLIRTDVIDI